MAEPVVHIICKIPEFIVRNKIMEVIYRIQSPFRPASVHVRYMLSPVRLSVVCLSSVTFVRRTQAVQIFGNTSTALGTLAIR